MIEWCYQGDDPKFLENHYKGTKNNETEMKKKVTGALAENLNNKCFRLSDPKEGCGKNEDVKDAMYFMNL